jgi:hypothetical protein
MVQKRYDVLCNDLAARRKDQLRMREAAERIAIAFRDAFAVFLGIQNDAQDALVQLRDLEIDDDEVVLADQSGQLALMNANFQWEFMIDVAVQNHNLLCRCRISMREDRTALGIGDRSDFIPVVLDDPASYNPACEALYKHLRRWLQWRPSNGDPEPKIGFELTRR